MSQDQEVQALSDFLLDFSSTLLSVGGQTSRVVRSTERIARSLGYNLELAIFSKHLMMTVICRKNDLIRRTSVREIKPKAFNFTVMMRLNTLSWNACDLHLPLYELRIRYEDVLTAPPLSRWKVLFMVACANAAFCRLFSGDWAAVGMVFIATLVAFFARQEMMQRHIDHRAVFLLSALIASGIASLDLHLGLGNTPQVALGTSVLFLIPGIPLINAINDILEGHVLMGFARAINAGILIACIALGLSITLLASGLNTL